MSFEQGKKAMPKRFSIQFTVVSIFLFATLFTVTIALCLQFYFSKQMASEYALNSFSVSAQNTSKYLNMIDRKTRTTVDFLSKYPPLKSESFLKTSVNAVFSDIIRNNSYFYSIYVGFPNGDSYEVVNLEANKEVRKKIRAAHSDRWVVVEVKADGELRKRTYSYYDDRFHFRISRTEVTDYIATNRPWYINAQHHKVYQTSPYLFKNIYATGQTYSTKVLGSESVIAIDIALGSISEYLQEQKNISVINKQSETYIYTPKGEVIASDLTLSDTSITPASSPLMLSDEQKKFIEELGIINVSNESDWAPVDFSMSGQPRGYSIDVMNLISEMTGLEFDYTNGLTWQQLVEQFKQGDLDVLHSVIETPYSKTLGAFSKPILSLPFYIVTQSLMSSSLDTPIHPKDIEEAVITELSQLSNKTLAIPEGWSIIPVIEKNYPDITLLPVSSTQEVLEFVKAGKAFAGIDNGAILTYTAKQHFIDELVFHKNIQLAPSEISTNLHVVVPQNNPLLLNIINLAIDNITKEQKSALIDKWFNLEDKVHNGSLEAGVPYQAMLSLASDKKNHNQLLIQELNNEAYYMYISPISAVNDYYFALLVPVSNVIADIFDKIKYSIFFTLLCLCFVLPICWWFAKPIVRPIKLLEAENKKVMNRDFDNVKRIDTRIIELDDLACSLVDMSHSIKQYELEQKQFLESIIKLIAQAIDDKSAYTAGHCNRVPELGIMLADAASVSTVEAFKDFSFKNDDETREFRIAAWLHDCGKIITPEHIVDKGSKLETIYNRIHEIRMRFEVLRRDAQIHYYEQLINSDDKSVECIELLQNELQARYAQLETDYHFVANTNIGGEMMEDADIMRLHEIAEQTWLRYFDDKIGLSPLEETQITKTAETLPVTEKLLADKAQHITLRTKNKTYDPKFGIKVDIPTNEANIGELYNLSIGRGTLTKEDRFKINEHIIGTIKMLDNLPFPAEFSRVPRYASTHHETLIGTGYPRKLTAENLSIPERILVLADIFEALTAADRPYKKAKPLSVSINILHNMVKDQHIDKDVFKLFLSSGIYKIYADKYLQPAQIDEVDVAMYLQES